MLNGGVRLQVAEKAISPDRSSSASAMAGLFAPLDRLLSGGGDPRLTINPATGLNEYLCQPYPCPDALSFSSSTATSISQRAYDRAEKARDELMRSAIELGIETALDTRVEAMRDELRGCLGLSPMGADVVFSPSGTDSQLQALLLARARLGQAMTTIVVAADQTGSGTVHTARGCHFSASTANGDHVRKGEPIAGLAGPVESIAVRLFDEAGQALSPVAMDSLVLGAVERSIESGRKVLLQVMDSSKFGWRAPSDGCLDEIATRWSDKVQVVVDACQMRLGRGRLRRYLDRGYLVIVTGSKFFTGPPFSGALLVPSAFGVDAASDIPSGFLEYFGRSDWPQGWQRLRERFPARINLGQWLRWEAALEEIGAYYRVPGEFRLEALRSFGKAVERLVGSSRSLQLLPPQQRPEDTTADDEELALRTIFPFVVRRGNRILSLDECKTLYRKLARGMSSEDPETRPCLIGQPVALGRHDKHPPAAIRISASARLVSEAFSSDENLARRNLQRVLDDVGAVVATIERLASEMERLETPGSAHEARA
jgi:hypothetical protein